MPKAKLSKEMLESVKGLSAAKAAERLGVGKTTVTDARAKYNMTEKSPPGPSAKASGKGGKIEQSASGSLIVESTDEVPQTRDHIEERMRSRGFDPEQYTFTYGFSEWEAQTGGGAIRTLYSARASATPRKPEGEPLISAAELEDVIESVLARTGGPVEVDDTVVEPNTFVFGFADPQIGKTDIRGGTNETIERFLNSLDHAETLLESEPATDIIWADLGDGIENFCNTSSQRQTNDLNLVEQVRVLRRLQWEGLMRLQRYAPVAHVSVPSNHSQNRVGLQQPASTSHDDWGLEVQVQLGELVSSVEDRLANPITFVQPEPHMESVAITTATGARVGFVHGHRSNSQDGLERWWAGQSLGRQPTHDADFLFVGHFHNLSVRSVGDERYIITFPSLDNGSSWFTVSRGNVATAGVLTMRLRGRTYPRDVIFV